MAFRFLLLFMILCSSVVAQEITYVKGKVTDSLVVDTVFNETYSLYLPTGFSGSEAMPVIFVFDPEGQGKKAAQLFKPAAEQQGYILVASNNLDTGKTLQENLNIAGRVVNHITAILPINFDLISVAGFSEAAKVATSLPALYRKFHGVIAVGDQQVPFEHLKEGQDFMFIGIVGDEQLNSYGMQVVSKEMKTLGFPSEIYTFNGGRKWPPTEIISSAVGSLTLHAIKKKKMPSRAGLVDSLYSQDLLRVERLKAQGKLVQAFEGLELLRSKYDGLKDLSEIKDRQKSLRRSDLYISQKNLHNKVKEKENRLIDDYLYFFHEDVSTSNFENLGWWNYQILQLDQYTKGINEAEVAMGYRLKSLLRELAKTQCRTFQETETDLEQELFANMLLTIFDQNDFEAYKKVISLSAIDGDFNSSLFYLEEMLKNGYSDLESLYEIEGTLALKMTPEFNTLVKKHLGSSKFHN